MIDGYVPTAVQPPHNAPDVGAYLAARFTWVRRTGDDPEKWVDHYNKPHGSSA